MNKLAFPKNMVRVTNTYRPKNNDHMGVDFGGTKIGDTVCWGCGDGIVNFTKMNNGNLGNTVRIYHPEHDISVLYAHLKTIDVSIGDIITKNSVVGIEGSSGNSTGAHLHFGMYKGDYVDYYKNTIDPMLNLFMYNEQVYIVNDNDVRASQVMREYPDIQKILMNVTTESEKLYKKTLIEIQAVCEEVL